MATTHLWLGWPSLLRANSLTHLFAQSRVRYIPVQCVIICWQQLCRATIWDFAHSDATRLTLNFRLKLLLINAGNITRVNTVRYSAFVYIQLNSRNNFNMKERMHSPRTSLFPGTVWIGCHVSQKRKCRGPSASQFSLPTSVWVAVSQLSIGEMGRMSPAGSWLPHMRGGECLHVIGTHTATQSLPNPISRNTTIYIQSMGQWIAKKQCAGTFLEWRQYSFFSFTQHALQPLQLQVNCLSIAIRCQNTFTFFQCHMTLFQFLYSFMLDELQRRLYTSYGAGSWKEGFWKPKLWKAPSRPIKLLRRRQVLQM